MPLLWTWTRTVRWVSAASNDSTYSGNLLQCLWTLTFIGIVRAPWDNVYKTKATFLGQNLSGTRSLYIRMFSGTAWGMWRHLVVKNSIILHANVRSHTAAAVTDLLRRWRWKMLEHPPYSPDMSPCDYNVFAKVKESLRGTRSVQEMNLSVLQGGQYGTATKMDSLMV